MARLRRVPEEDDQAHPRLRPDAGQCLTPGGGAQSGILGSPGLPLPQRAILSGRAFDAERALRAGRLNVILPAGDFTPSRVDFDLPPEFKRGKVRLTLL
jgi:hypothetical protein